MKASALWCVGGYLALLAGAASAGEPDVGPPFQTIPGVSVPVPAPPGTTLPPPPVSTPVPAPPGTTLPPPHEDGPRPDFSRMPAFPSDECSHPHDADAPAPAGAEPALFGDLLGIRGNRVIVIPTVRGRTVAPPGTQLLGGDLIAVVAPLPLHASYKIAEDESPRPQDRVYFNYNYYDDVDRLLPRSVGLSDVNRETIGFEKAFADGNASVGLRLPFLQLIGSEVAEDDQVGDLSIVAKYAVLNDRERGNLISAGVVVTAPTGQALQIAREPDLRDTVVQPFVGYLYHFNTFYIEGFSSAAVPTDRRDVAVMFNSIGVGYEVFQDNSRTGLIQGIVPQAELHVNTPLTHRGLTNTPVNFSDVVDFTGGCHFQFRRTDLGVALSLPVTGPIPYDVETEVNVAFHW